MTEPTPELLAFGTFIRGAARAAGLHDDALNYVQTIAWRAEAGHTPRPRTLSRLAELLGLAVDEVLSRTPGGPSDLQRLVNRGLARAGLTMRDVEKQTGINAQQVQQWISGQRRPTVQNLEALANLLGEPDLTKHLSPYAPSGKVNTTCSSCGRTRLVWPNKVTDLCKTCAGRTTGQTRVERIRKRSGRAGLHQLGQQLVQARQRWRAENPGQEAAILAKLQAGGRAHTKTPLELARNRLGMLSLDPPGRFGLCRLCGRLTFFKHKDIARATEEGRPGFGTFHGACAVAWSRSPEMREWASQCRRKPGGTQPPPMPMPPRPSTRSSSAKELREAYTATVRYLRQTSGSSRRDRNELGIPLNVAELARTMGLSPRGLHNRVDRFLSLLPDEARATGPVKTWREIFLSLQGRAPNSPPDEASNSTRFAHPEAPNATRFAQP